ncbi:hypothetical protein [Entomobacter blattae]|uniref:Uncharacterized protein n=1 Tax=Entomobacter blattae TaxID=2762277 RepID=A0A7H1NQD2_9PROT|nr:hypothetical protein [Entomobacter blattae]QNT77992.1 hypothetical protein JGUZn3_07570 [Entomobacter blattae]
MSRTTLVQTTTFSQYSPLGWSGQLLVENWPTLYELLLHRMGAEYANLLLEPVIDRKRGVIDWYIPPQAALSPLQQTDSISLQRRAHVMLERIKSFAISLRDSPQLADHTKAEMLLMALNYPDYTCLVHTEVGIGIVGWGHEPTGKGILPEALSMRGQEIPSQTITILPSPSPSSPPKSTSLWWIFLPSLIALALLVALPWKEGWLGIENFCRYYWVWPVIALLLIGLALLALQLIRRKKPAPSLSSPTP